MKKFMRYYLTILMILSMMGNIVFAGGAGMEASNGAYDNISIIIGRVLNAASWFGYAIALGMFIYIGAKYTTSAANEKANVKQGLINYLIGAVLIACASLVADIVSGIAAGGATGTSGIAGSIIQAGKDAAGIK